MLIRIMRCKGRTPDVAAEAEFSEAGGTIGRSSQCTLALPDADRHISRIQAEVSWSGTAFLLTDRGSGNSTLRNGEAVGMGQTVPLADGDELHIGDYVLRVESPPPRAARCTGGTRGDNGTSGTNGQPCADAELASTARNLDLAPADNGQAAHRHSSPGTGSPAASVDPVENLNAGGNIAFRSWESSDGVGSTAINPGRHREAPQCAMQAPPLHGTFEPRGTGFSPFAGGRAKPPSPATPVLESKRPPGPGAASASSLLAALLAGAGLQEAPQDPVSGKHFELDEHTMERLGSLLRLLSQGVIDLLATRTMLKSEMHAAVTVIAVQGNNPLKFSPDACTALAFLLAPESPRGFMAPELAVEDAMSDLLAHQMGMLSGMRAALEGVLLRFEPRRLEARLAPKSLLGGVLPMNRKAKLWEQFEALYEAVCGEAQDDFEGLFSEAFVRAYEERIAELRHRPAASNAGIHGHAGNADNPGNTGTTGER
ncbi:type VI secretion system-associated FHA domain protein TagH [Noviherbaspirillum sp. CPCC 100848]|uniref:Type VI secretion system-associated FHA domain protein TagH n=1 Tax=Noviherbaspirillum album TaxID=3080276 RepID=A0ABU6J2Y1_9BURK|nr:type VI secretion system-associated FHA domain protein TagH [Noviherbaspirillum sp. CPCC 100848]MEC4717786.1 type VI secretion system-associated FHA domain protein TagH [Noviherbaspirillum sp. CPCC 100848]